MEHLKNKIIKFKTEIMDVSKVLGTFAPNGNFILDDYLYPVGTPFLVKEVNPCEIEGILSFYFLVMMNLNTGKQVTTTVHIITQEPIEYEVEEPSEIVKLLYLKNED